MHTETQSLSGFIYQFYCDHSVEKILYLLNISVKDNYEVMLYKNKLLLNIYGKAKH